MAPEKDAEFVCVREDEPEVCRRDDDSQRPLVWREASRKPLVARRRVPVPRA